jgi:two-component system response regulator YesN
MKYKKVLIVDDEMYIRRMMADIVDWREYGLELAGEADSGPAALDFLSGNNTDVLITDLTMPGMDALEYLKRVRERYPGMIIIVLTMHKDFELIQEAMRIGVDDYIAKVQADKKDFGALLKRVLEKPRGERANKSALQPAADPEAKSRLNSLLAATGWILDDAAFEETLRLIPLLHYNMEQLSLFLYRPMQLAEGYTGISPEAYFREVKSFNEWPDWERWLRHIRSTIPPSASRDSSASQSIRAALAYLNAHFSEQVSLRDLLRHTALSKSYFSALFKEHTGATFVEYLQKLRVEQAQRYLTDTDWNISEIGERVGYSGERNFRKAFQQYTGMSPAAYRKLNN